MEINQDKICRICLKESNNMETLFALRLTKDGSFAVEFIRKITDLKVRITVYNIPHFIKFIVDCRNGYATK